MIGILVFISCDHARCPGIYTESNTNFDAQVRQRELRLKEKEEGRTWERRYFSLVENDKVLSELGPNIGVTPEEDKTGGVWRYDEVKASKLPLETDTPIFLTPTSTITREPTAGSAKVD
jgi:hypothetical protein